MQPPTSNATSATHRALALLTLGDPDAKDAEKQGESLPLPGFAVMGIETTGTDPESVEQARKLDDWPAWDASIKKELDQHKKMGTWILVKPPPDINVIGSRLVLRYKRDATRAIVSCKSQFIAQGFSQIEGVDYNETFAPTAKLSAIQIVATLAVRNNWELEQMDVDSTYLNAPLKETIYMWQAKGYEEPGKPNHVCLLKCAVYGIRQAGHEWYDMLCQIMYGLNFKCCRVEHTVFYKHEVANTILVAADVDDMTIARSSKRVICKFKEGLNQKVKIKDLGNLHWMLGIEVERDRATRTISFSQCTYITKILEWFGLQDTNPLSTPLDPHHRLTLAQCPDTPCQYENMKNVPYHEAIRSLMYAALGT